MSVRRWIAAALAASVIVVGVGGVWFVRNRKAGGPRAQDAPPPAPGETRLADGLNSPTALCVLPDGRVLVAQQAGDVRLVDQDGARDEPVLTVKTQASDEEGLTAIAIDPDFERNGHLYVTYTALEPTNHQRVSRFTFDLATGRAGDELALLDLPPNREPFHLGTALAFMVDGTLLISTGEGSGDNPQSLDSLAGKILRVSTDGTIPSDNPFFDQTEGLNRAIWALGFRAPFAMAVHPGDGRALVSDVGETSFEEVNEVLPGANYGWPNSEGPTSVPGQTSPLYSYGREDGCAIVGGTFVGDGYFFMDYCNGAIRRLDLSTETVTNVGTVTGQGPVAIAGSGGDILYLIRSVVLLDGGTGRGFDKGALYRRAAR